MTERSPAPRSEPTGASPAARWLTALVLTLVAAGLTMRLPDLDPLRRLELLTLDTRFRLRGTLPPGPDVALLAIDDRSVAAVGHWPIPRDVLADAVRRLAAAGAAVIALDLLLTEPSAATAPLTRRALERARDRLPADDPDRPALDAALADVGAGLAAVIAASDRVVLPYSFTSQAREGNALAMPPWIASTAYAVVTGEPAVETPAAGLLVPADGLTAAGAGHVGLLLDVDGALRFDQPAFPAADRLYPSFAVEAVRLLRRVPRDGVAILGTEKVEIGPLTVPLGPRLQQLVGYYGPRGTIATLSMADLLDGSLRPGRVAGKIVIVGVTATGAGDRFATPFDQQLPGAEFLATAMDNILTDRALIRDARAEAIDLLALALLAVAGAWLGGRGSVARSTAVGLGLVTLWLGVVGTAFVQAHLWLGAVAPTLAALGAVGTVETMRVTDLQRRRRRLELQRANLSRYFAPAVVDRLAERTTTLDRTQEAAVMFVDLVGFTGRAESMTPAAAMALLRAFHARVETAVFAHGGMLDKFIGDGALACFGVPEATPSACADALRAATALVDATAALSRELEADGQPGLRVSIGLHHGPVLMGDIGGRHQLQFTVVGDTVNVAARIEALTRGHETAILASDPVMLRAPEEARHFERAGEVPIRGRDGRVSLWRPRSDAGG